MYLNFSFILDIYPADVNRELEHISQDSSPPSCNNYRSLKSLFQTINECREKSAKMSPADSNYLSINPTPTYITEPIVPADHTELVTVEVYSTIPTITNIITRKPKKATDLTKPTTTESISMTTPPDPIQSTETITEICTNSTQELTSTIVPTIVVSPTTEHTRIIEPTLVTDYTGTTNIMKTVPVSVMTATVLDDSFGGSNTTSVIVGTVTPSL